jgi:hypothetical protein
VSTTQEPYPERIVMIMSKFRSVLGVLATLGLLGSAALGAGDPTPEEALKGSGLKRAGFTYVHTESETQARKKANDARLTLRQLAFANMQVSATEQGKMETLDEFENQRMFLMQEIAEINQNLSMLSGNNGGNNAFGGAGGFGNTGGISGVGGGFASNRYANIQISQLTNQRNMLNNSLNMLSRRYDQIKNQANDPNVKKEIAAELKSREDSHHKAILAFREAIDAATKKYEELEKNADVKKSLDTLSKPPKAKLKLGPSKEFATLVKTLEKMEKEDAAGETKATSTTKSSAKGKRSTSKSRRSTRSNSGANNMPNAFPDNSDSPF